jgi:cellulose synthase (UDP-forming)
MIINTLMAIKAIEYPHETYLCDENFCEENGIQHVSRARKTNAKAGNINHALQNFCKGELVVIMDPDHIPRPESLAHFAPDSVALFGRNRQHILEFIQI